MNEAGPTFLPVWGLKEGPALQSAARTNVVEALFNTAAAEKYCSGGLSNSLLSSFCSVGLLQTAG